MIKECAKTLRSRNNFKTVQVELQEGKNYKSSIKFPIKKKKTDPKPLLFFVYFSSKSSFGGGGEVT